MVRLGERFWRYQALAIATAGMTMALTMGLAAAPSKVVAKAEATDARLIGDKASTTFQLTLSEGLMVQAFTLADPYRVILDLPDLTFQLDPAVGQKGRGLVTAFRYGLFAENKSRVVIDTTGPVKITSAAMTRVGSGKSVRLAVVLSPIDAASFGAGTGATRPPEPDAGAKRSPRVDKKAEQRERSKPVVVIDPGHGGIDPGAIGINNVFEKTIVLAVAKQLEAALNKIGGYDVKNDSNGRRLRLARRSAGVFRRRRCRSLHIAARRFNRRKEDSGVGQRGDHLHPFRSGFRRTVSDHGGKGKRVRPDRRYCLGKSWC